MRDVSSETPDVTTKHNCYDLSQHTSTIEGNPLQKKETHYYSKNPYYRRKCLAVEGKHNGKNVLLAINWATESRHLNKMKHISIKMGDLAETSP